MYKFAKCVNYCIYVVEKINQNSYSIGIPLALLVIVVIGAVVALLYLQKKEHKQAESEHVTIHELPRSNYIKSNTVMPKRSATK